MLLRRLLHALLEEHFKLRTDLLCFAFEFVQEFAFFVDDLAIGEQHSPQPGGLLGVDPAVRQDMVLDGLIKELLEGGCHMLNPLVQLDEEIGPRAINLAACVKLTAQQLQLVTIYPSVSQNGLFDFSEVHHDLVLLNNVVRGHLSDKSPKLISVYSIRPCFPGPWLLRRVSSCYSFSVLGNEHGWLKLYAVNRATSRQFFRFGFVGNAPLNECMMAGLGKFHCVPLTLLTNGIHPAHFSVDRHPIGHPHLALFSFSHFATPSRRWKLLRRAFGKKGDWTFPDCLFALVFRGFAEVQSPFFRTLIA